MDDGTIDDELGTTEPADESRRDAFDGEGACRCPTGGCDVRADHLVNAGREGLYELTA